MTFVIHEFFPPDVSFSWLDSATVDSTVYHNVIAFFFFFLLNSGTTEEDCWTEFVTETRNIRNDVYFNNPQQHCVNIDKIVCV